MFSHAPPSGGILAQYPPSGGYPQTTRSAFYSLFFTINRKQKLRLLFDFMVGKHPSILLEEDKRIDTSSARPENNPTTSLECVDQICPRRIAVLRRSRQGKAALATPVNPRVRSVCSRSVVVGLLHLIHALSLCSLHLVLCQG